MLSPLIALAGAASGCFIYVLAAAVYNLYLHPLSGLPGPRSWIVFPLLRHIAAMRGLFDIRMREFHDHYGDVVRYGLPLFFQRNPRSVLTMLLGRINSKEISFITSQAWKDIYGHGHKQLPKWIVKEPGRASSIVSRLSRVISDDILFAYQSAFVVKHQALSE